MRGKLRRGWALSMVAVLAVVVAWLLYAVWQSPHRADLSTYGAFAVAVVVPVAGCIGWAWQRAKRSPVGREAADDDLDRVADLLAQAVHQQWDLAASERGLSGADPISVTWGRPTMPLTGPAAAATGSHRFDPLPGLRPIGEADLAEGLIANLHVVYGGLRSGRLVIAGPPGSGKSGAAVLLILTALKYRHQLPATDQIEVPVPVLVTAQDWDPRRHPVVDWIAGLLRETYPLFTGTTGAANAAALIAAGKIAVIIDGLDEVAEQLRPTALQALSQQANFRVVVLSRTAEMASAASRHGVLQGAAAIELRAIDPTEAASYLERVQLAPPPQGWQNLTERIRTSPLSPLSKALNNPLTLTLVRDTYQAEDDARELLDFCDTMLQTSSGDQATEEITGHLLDRVLPAAYAHRPGEPPPRYDLKTARNALTKIAASMNQEGTRDLQWWRITNWASRAQRFLVVGLVAGLVMGVVTGLTGGPGAGIGYGVAVWGAVGSGSAASKTPNRLGGLRLRRAMNRTGLLAAVLGGVVAGLGVGLGTGLGTGLVIGAAVVGALVAGLGGGLVAGLADPDSTSSSSPVLSWSDDRKYALVVGAVSGLAGGLVIVSAIGIGLMASGEVGLGGGLAFGVSSGIAIGLSVGLWNSAVWGSSLAAVQLAMNAHTPVQIMRFLDDARQRNILRTVGSVYQFRHASLQDRLAAASTEAMRPPRYEDEREDQ